MFQQLNLLSRVDGGVHVSQEGVALSADDVVRSFTAAAKTACIDFHARLKKAALTEPTVCFHFCWMTRRKDTSMSYPARPLGCGCDGLLRAKNREPRTQSNVPRLPILPLMKSQARPMRR